MKSITLHNLDPQLSSLIAVESQQTGQSLNKTIQSLLKKALGLTYQRKKADFSAFAGDWSQKESREFAKNMQQFSQIDPEDWR